MYITGITSSDADEKFSIIETSGITEGDREYMRTLLPEAVDTPEEVVLYIQNNYSDIVSNLTTIQKEMMDIFFLEQSMMYYCGNYEAYCDLKEIYELRQSLAAVRGVQSRGPVVCKLTIFSDKGGESDGSSADGVGFGRHAWLRFENKSTSTIMVGGKSVGPGEAVTIGTTSSEAEHKGAWYNLEYMRINNYDNCYSKSVNIDSNTLSILSQLLKAHDDWSKTQNCSYYASIVWNQSGGVTLSPGVIPTPVGLANSIINTGSYNINESFTAMDLIYYNATTATYCSRYND